MAGFFHQAPLLSISGTMKTKSLCALILLSPACTNEFDNNFQDMFKGLPASSEQIVGVWADHIVLGGEKDWRKADLSGDYWVFREDNTAAHYIKDVHPDTGGTCWNHSKEGVYLEKGTPGDFELFGKPKRIEINNGFLVMEREENHPNPNVHYDFYVGSRAAISEDKISPACPDSTITGEI